MAPSPLRARLAVEAGDNLRLALPLIVAQLAGVGMGAVDTLFAGRLGADALAAVAIGVNLNVVYFVFAMGLLMACSAVVAQHRGRGAASATIGAFMRDARVFGFGAGVVWFVLANTLSPLVIRRLGLAESTTATAVTFCHALSFSALGFTQWFALRFCAEGAGESRPVLLGGLVGLGSNTLLDWLLVFGHGGFPALGAMGCGVATSVSSVLMAGVLAASYRMVPRLRLYRNPGGNTGAMRAGHWREILRVGTPIACILLAEAGLFVLTAILMARFGDASVAGYQVAINFASLLFMIPLGVGQATTVRVGLAVGAGDRAAARFRGAVGMVLGLLNALSNAAIMALGATFIVGLYTADAAISGLAAGFLRLAAAFQFFDGLQVTANGGLRGLKDTRVPMLLTLISYWAFGLPVAWSLAFFAGWGAGGLWWGLTAGLGLAAVTLTWRFHRQTRVVGLAPPAA